MNKPNIYISEEQIQYLQDWANLFTINYSNTVSITSKTYKVILTILEQVKPKVYTITQAQIDRILTCIAGPLKTVEKILKENENAN